MSRIGYGIINMHCFGFDSIVLLLLGTLIIRELRQDDSGTYFCNVWSRRHGIDKDIKRINLNVQGKLTFKMLTVPVIFIFVTLRVYFK